MKMIMMFKKAAWAAVIIFLFLSAALSAAQEFEDDVDDEVVDEEPPVPIDIYIPILLAGGTLIGYWLLKRPYVNVK
ncbi:hypothetical protein [Flavobacterium sp.]|uniref:hypothetical protein n=1 Tax=Flavobacterium sp. TaxID=239 RepID=UPI004033C720